MAGNSGNSRSEKSSSEIAEDFEERLLEMQVLWLETFQRFQLELTQEMLLHGYAFKRRLEGSESAAGLSRLLGNSGRLDFEGMLKGTNSLLIRFGRRIEEGLNAMSEARDFSAESQSENTAEKTNPEGRFRRLAQIKP